MAAAPSFIVALHDATPESWPDYRPFVERMDAIGGVRMSWLVVPDFHHRSATFSDPAFLALLERRLALGDELVLHGLYHCDEGPAPTGLRDYFMRRFYTVEGEFYALDEAQARTRIEQGLELFARRGWPLHGFVAPAWLMSPGTRRALAGLPLRYSSDPGHLLSLPSFTPHRVPTLVWSARARWRRAMSLLVNECARLRYRRLDTLRLGLHPIDMRFASSREYWYRCIERLLDQGYRAETKREWIDRHGGF